MKRILSKVFITTLLAVGGYSALGSPIGLSADDFTATATTVDFNALSNWQRFDNRYAGSNVTFDGALFGMSNSGDTNLFNGSTIVSNWQYWPGPGMTGSSWSATFGSLITMVGFFVETNAPDSVIIEAFAGDDSRGPLTFANPNGYIPDFLGLGKCQWIRQNRRDNREHLQWLLRDG